MVTLGDVAEIASADARQTATLSAIELFPAPPRGEQRIVRVREIQDLLLLRGVNLTEHRFSGSSEVVVLAAVARPPAGTLYSGSGSIRKLVRSGESERIKRRVSEALVKYLSERDAALQGCSVHFELTDAQALALANPVRPLQVAGGYAPWTGPQRFELAVEGAKEPAPAVVDANVHAIAPVVVALRPLARGAVIREGDVELRHLLGTMPGTLSGTMNPGLAEKIAGALHALEEAIGHELVRPVSTGMPVPLDSLRAPLAVHRGEIVTVYAQSGAVRIRTNARARDEGSVGELVAVESLLNRSTYYARVSGVREVEVYARSPRVAGTIY